MLTEEELKARLGADVYESLKAQFTAPQKSAEADLILWLRGSLKSFTNWFGLFLIAAPDLLPQLQPDLQDLLGEHAASKVLRIIEVAVILLRFKTTKSIKDKGVKQ